MDWTAPIDLYCERLGPGLWAEPVNAISNLAFLFAAAAASAALQRTGRRDPAMLALILLVATIGIGSLLFHIFANGWSVLADVIPITGFIYAYLALALRRFFRFSWLASGLCLVLFFVLSFPVEALLRPLLAGSAGYVPAFAAMLLTGSILATRRHPAGTWLLAAAALFLLSLTFRTLDAPFCAAFPSGTHFLWHFLNAATLATLLLAAIRHAQARVPAALTSG